MLFSCKNLSATKVRFWSKDNASIIFCAAKVVIFFDKSKLPYPKSVLRPNILIFLPFPLADFATIIGQNPLESSKPLPIFCRFVRKHYLCSIYSPYCIYSLYSVYSLY